MLVPQRVIDAAPQIHKSTYFVSCASVTPRADTVGRIKADAALAPAPATEWTACCPVGTATIREPACWPGPYPKDDLQSPGELEVMMNCQAIALNQERKPRTNEREPHVAPRHYGRNLANTYVHSRVCYLHVPLLCFFCYLFHVGRFLFGYGCSFRF